MAERKDVVVTPKAIFTLKIEEEFEKDDAVKWALQNDHLPFCISLVYVVLVFSGQYYMRNKHAANLKYSLFLWNILLALFSALGAFRVLPELLHGLYHFGLKFSVCSFTFYDNSPVIAFWTYLFVMSKTAELLDTFFLVVRKRPVIFLHWFHHCSVLVFSWITLADRVAVGRWFQGMNYTVHSIMYSYYAITSLKIKCPKVFAMSITVVQTLQMFVGFYVSFRAFIFWINGEVCASSGRTLFLALSLYGLYGILFLKFLLNSYFGLKRRKKD